MSNNIKIESNSNISTPSTNNTSTNGNAINAGGTNNSQKLSSSNDNNSNSSNNNNNSKSNNMCNLIVNYLPQSMKENDFNMLFSKIGQLKSCKLMLERNSGYSYGYGFVEYANEEDARKAIDTLNGYQVEHKRLKVAYARPNSEETKNTNLYIRNIPLNYDEQQLNEIFSQYGEVVQVRLLRDQNTSCSRRIGFVIMATKQMAQVAIQNLDNTIPTNAGNTEPIYVKYADEEGKKRHGGGGGGAMGHQNNGHHRMNNGMSHHHNQSQHHQNQSFINNFSQQQMAGFNFNNSNSFMMHGGGGNNMMPNLGKMKSNRSGGHQNRYNPISGMGNGSQGGNGNNGGNYNQWNMNTAAMAAAMQQQQQQPGYTSFTNNTSAAGGNFDNIINTIGSGSGAGLANGPYHPHGQNNNYLNLNSAMAAVAGGGSGLSGSTSSGNLLDVMDQAAKNQLMAAGGGIGGGGAASNASNGHIIYVYGIGSQATESDLYALFSSCGRINRVNVIKNQKTGQCKGYGFVVFETYDEAFFAVHNMNGYMYNNRPLQVQLNAGHSN